MEDNDRNYALEYRMSQRNIDPEPARATADEAGATPTIEQLLEQAREYRKAHPMTPAEHRGQCISFAYGNVHLANPNVTREMVEAAYDELHPDEAARAEKEPLADRPQGVDVAALRERVKEYLRWVAQASDAVAYPRNAVDFLCCQVKNLLDELERLRGDWSLRLALQSEAKHYLDRAEAAEARVAELEQRLRVVADPDGAEREALKARVKELERILSAERAEYDWAVKGAKALEAKLARAQNVVRVSSMDAGTKTHLLTILNGGTDGTA